MSKQKEPKAPKQKKMKPPRQRMQVRVSSFHMTCDLMLLTMVVFAVGITVGPMYNKPEVHHLGHAVVYFLGLGLGLIGGIWLLLYAIRQEKNAPAGKHMNTKGIVALLLVTIAVIRLVIDFAHEAKSGGYSELTVEVGVGIVIALLAPLLVMMDIYRPRIRKLFVGDGTATSPQSPPPETHAVSSDHETGPLGVGEWMEQPA